MAARKVILKLNHIEALVKCVNDVDGAASLTIGLSTDLLRSDETLSGDPVKVNLSNIDCTCADLKEINIVRNSKLIVNLFENTTTLPYTYGADSEESTSDVVVNFTGKGTVYLRFLKQSGYKPNYRPEQGIGV